MPFVNTVTGKFGFGRPTKPGNITGSIRFAGSPQYLSTPLITAIGTATATVEFWFYADATTGTQRLVTTSLIGFVAKDFAVRYEGGSFKVGDGSSGITSSTLPAAGVWHHVAWVGTSGTSQEIFLNGSRVGTGGAYEFIDQTFTFGGRSIATEYFAGYIACFRYVRGTAVYSGATYTVPTKTLDVISGTELLLKTIQGGSVKGDSSTNNYTMINGPGGGGTSNALTPFP